MGERNKASDGNTGNQGGNVRNQGGNAGNQGGNAGNQGGNAGNQGGNAGNQGNSLWESLFIASAKIQEREGSISPSNFYGQLPDY